MTFVASFRVWRPSVGHRISFLITAITRCLYKPRKVHYPDGTLYHVFKPAITLAHTRF
jgi:hypothetical protein